MTDLKNQAQSLFLGALEIPGAAERAAYLDSQCGDDSDLRKDVEELLDHVGRLGNFMNPGDGEPHATVDHGCSGIVGAQIGAYKIREQIGEGGMGEVYVAEQIEPVRRKVALKIIRPGMATKDVLARFEAERQALAMMDHPNIARIFDGGAVGGIRSAERGVRNEEQEPVARKQWSGTSEPKTPISALDNIPNSQFCTPHSTRQPYFVMELVQGPPITKYCDQQRLGTRGRLGLFHQVCRAVQHAHQKGVIHRDLKPSNILVPRIDGKAVPKVIDFGIAKAVGQKLTEHTVYTQFSQMIGTPLYMSPEQAEMGVVDIDTKSDIYALGVLLYELLTGHTPFDGQSLKEASFDEMRRIIREDEPPRPSAMISSLKADALSTVSARRRCDPRRLSHELQGELDWVVMKCLEKDRNRRYESASALAMDIEHYLHDEEVSACPPSMLYRFRKFARRNRTLLTSGTAIAVLLLVCSLVSTTLYLDARRERDRAQSERNRAQEALEDNLELRRQQTIETAFSLAASSQAGKEDKALRVIQDALISDEDKREVMAMLDAERKIIAGVPSEAIEILKGLNPDDHDLIVRAMLATAYFVAGDYWEFYEFPEAQGVTDPRTPYEHLFVGKAEMWLDFQKSIEHLDVAATLTPSPLSFTYRAQSSAFLACSTRDSQPAESQSLIDQAVEDIEIAERLYKLRASTGDDLQIRSDVLGNHLLVLLHAYNINTYHGFHKKADDAMIAAAEIVDELTNDRERTLENLEFLRSWIGFYYQHHAKQLRSRGKSAEADVAERESRKWLMDTLYGPWLLLADLIRLDPRKSDSFEKRQSDLLAELKSAKDRAFRPNFILASYYLMSSETDIGRSKVYQLVEQLKQRPDLKIGQVLEICHIYQILGDVSACRRFASRHLAERKLFQNLHQAEQALKYNAGYFETRERVEREVLRNRHNTGVTTTRLFTIGLSELRQGHQDAALERFEQVGREGIFHSTEYDVVLAFRDRLKDDPNWRPSWFADSTASSDE